MQLIKRNLGWMMMSQCSTFLLSLVLLLVVPDLLGDEAFGKLSFVMVYISFFDLLAQFGTSTFLLKTVSRDRETVGHMVFNTVLMKAFVATALSVVAIGLAMAMNFDSELIALIAIGCINMFINALNSGILGGLYGLQRMRGPALTDLARAYVAGVIGVIIVYTTGSLRLMLLSTGLACLIPLFINLKLLWPEIRGRCRLDFSVWKVLVHGGLPFFIWTALSTFYGTIDIPMLHAYAGDDVVGWYALAYKWVNMPIFFASVVGTACLPALSAEGTRLSQSFIHLANRATYFVALVTIPAAVGLMLVAQQLLDVIYHGQFDGAVPLMQILAVQVPVVSLDIILGTVVIAADRQRQWVIVAVVAALFNPLFNAMAMPVTERLFNNAAIGASVSTVLTEVVLLGGALILRPAGVFNRSTAGLVGRILAASCCMVPIVLALGSAALPVRVVVGMVTFAVAAVALRAVSLQEMRSMALGFVRRRDEQPTGATA